MLWKCNDCNRLFYEPNEKTMSCACYYGVDEHVGIDDSITVSTCPECGSEDIEELDYEESEALENAGRTEGDKYVFLDY
jgi:NMD protein affecting ribosome stability and mRNA decay